MLSCTQQNYFSFSYKSVINYTIAYSKPQNKRYCAQYMIAIAVYVVLKMTK